MLGKIVVDPGVKLLAVLPGFADVEPQLRDEPSLLPPLDGSHSFVSSTIRLLTLLTRFPRM